MMSFVAASLLALTSLTGHQSGSLGGQIVDDLSGRPIPGAVVVITRVASGPVADRGALPRPRETSTHSETDGRYRVDDLAPGNYLVRVEHPDYVSHEHRRFTPERTLELAVVAAGRHLPIDVRLARAATVRGQVTDEAGRPLADVSVSTTIAVEGRMSGVRSTTNDRGEYELRLPTGSYVLEAMIPPAITDGLQVTFYPGVAKREDAPAVRVSAGDRLSDLNIMMSRSALSIITGRVIPNAAPPERVPIFLVSSPAGKYVRTTTQTDGSFRFDRLKPGRYIVWSKVSTPDSVDVAAQTVDVIQDSRDLELALAPGGRVSGRVVAEGPAALDGVRVIAALMDGSHDVDPTAPDQVEIDEQGRFTIDGLFGTRLLRVIGLPAGWSVKTILVNGREASPPQITITASTTVDGVRIMVTAK